MVLDEKQQQQSSGVFGDDSYAAGAMRSSSKKNKHKKIPQRGLGVAQLEKLRLEEQQKDVDAASSSSSDPSVAQALVLLPQPPPYVPLPPGKSAARPPRVPSYNMNMVFRPQPVPPASSMVDLLGAAPAAEAVGEEQQGLLSRLCLDPKICGTECVIRKFGYHVPPRADLLNGNCKSMSPMQRKQPPQPPITLANTAALPLPLPLPLPLHLPSGVNLPMEPPSNQSNSISYDLLSCWKEQERNLVKMVGSKRSWPFHVDGISGQTSFPHKLPPLPSSCLRSEECSSAHGNNLARYDTQAVNSYLKPQECLSAHESNLVKLEYPTLRGGTLSALLDLTSSSDHHLDKRRKENGSASDNSSFLSLGTLSTPTARSGDNPQFYQQDHSDFNYTHSQKSLRNSSSSQKEQFFCFLPMGPISSDTTLNERKGEATDDIDLDLKL